MIKFSEFIVEGLSYKVSKDRLDTFKDLSNYRTKTKGTVSVYSKDGKDIFSYDSKTGKLVVMKQGWQLMNLERGY